MSKWKVINIVILVVFLTCNAYTQCAIPSLIPNSNFESMSNCPSNSQQITVASGWQETSTYVADYYNTCGYKSISSSYNPPPTMTSGGGYLGLGNNSTGAKKYASSCLSSSMISGMNYTFQFEIAAAEGATGTSFDGMTSNPNFTMVLYGSTSCPVATFSGSSCPTSADGWEVITTVSIVANGTGWTIASSEFVPTSNFQSIAIGPDCNAAPSNVGLCSFGLCNNYYYIDNLILNLTDLYPTVAANANQINDCNTPSNNLEATISGGTPNFSYSWTPTSGLSDATLSNPIADPAITTNYTVTITDANGCTDTDVVKVTVDKTPPIANAGPDKTIDCDDETVELNGSGGTTYLWSPGTGLTSTTIANPTSGAENTITYTMTAIGNNGCIDTDDVTVIVDKDLPVVTTGPNVSTDCDFPDAQLTATGGGTYKWAPSIGLSNSNIANPVARPPSTTNYTVTVTSPNGCKKTGSTSVIINDPTPIAEAGPNKNLCGQYSLNLTPNISTQLPIDTYLWSASPDNPTTVVFSDDTNPNSNVSNLIEGTYKLYWTVSNNVCPPVLDSMLINVYDLPVSQAGLDDSLCSEYTTQFNANSAEGRANGKWSLQSNFSNPNPAAVVFSDINSPTSTVSGLQEGEYHFIWTISNGSCPAKRDTVAISVFDEPIANAGIDDSLCNLFKVNLAATNAIGTAQGLWTQASSINPSIATIANNLSPSTLVSDLIEGTYVFIWEVSNGSCSSDIDSVNINVYETPVSNAGIDASVCGYDSLNLDTLFFLNSNIPMGTSHGLWSVAISSSTPSAPLIIHDTNYFSGVTNLLEGEYDFVWTVSNGNCNNVTDTIKVLTFDKPIANAGEDQSLCADYLVTFTADQTNGTAIGKWSAASNWNNPSMIQIDDDLNPVSTSSGYIEGVYKFVWTVTNGVCSPIVDTVVITIFDAPIANAGTDIEMCASSFTSLNAIDPIGTSSGVWNQDYSYNSASGISFDDDTLNTTNSINYIEGAYRLIWTVSNGVCQDDKDSVLVTTYNMPIANAGFDQYNCDLDTVLLNGSGNVGTATGEWVLDPTYPYPSIPLFRDSSIENTIADNLVVGDYSMLWIVENGVCPSDTDTVIIHNMQRPVAIADYTQLQCDNKCFKVTSLSTAPEGDGLLAHWEIDDLDYFDSIPDICIDIAGDYKVNLTVTASNGCVDSIVNYPLINVQASPSAGFVLNFESDSLIELQRVDIEDLSSNDVLYYWYSMGNGDTIKNKPEFIYFYNNDGIYEVTQWVENQYRCRDSIVLVQEVQKRRNIFVPNTFTPNNDGVNDIFIPVTRGLSTEQYEFAIFDRWGTMIFRTTSLDIGWDGTYKGQVVKDDAYIWKLQYSYGTHTDHFEEQGHVMIYKFSR